MEELKKVASENHVEINSKEFAILMDERDKLKDIRRQFEYPKKERLPYQQRTFEKSSSSVSEDSIYLCGNSLGLMPASARDTMTQVMDQWGEWGVCGHDNGPLPWQLCDEQLIGSMAKLVGAQDDEIAIMNQLTINLHLLMLSFYRPTAARYKILHEHKPFPSDQYSLVSQVRMHNLDPDDALISVAPRPGEYCTRLEDILAVLANQGDTIALVLMGGLHFYTGEFMNIAIITKEAHRVGAYVGWDLAHAVGNLELALHDWDVDWAVWTTYKYLNAGPGGTGAAFLHSRHFQSDFPYLTGWWGHEYRTRMEMPEVMEPGVGIRRYRMSTPSAFHCATLRASLEIFDNVGMKSIREKSVVLTAYFEYLLQSINSQLKSSVLEIITPSIEHRRGAQLSVLFQNKTADEMHDFFKTKGLVCDVRKPNVIRLAACPLYNSFLDVYRAYEILFEEFSAK